MTLGAGAALAQGAPETIPGGPYGENESLASLRSYAQLVHAIDQAVASGHGVATRHVAPWKSNTGRDVPYVVIGTGPTAVDHRAAARRRDGNERLGDRADSHAGEWLRGVEEHPREAHRRGRAARERRRVRRPKSRRHADQQLDRPEHPRHANAAMAGDDDPGLPRPRAASGPLSTPRLRYDINRYHAFRPECPLDNPNFPNITTGVVSCETQDVDSTGPYRWLTSRAATRCRKRRTSAG